MAELAVVYDCSPVARSPAEVMARSEDGPKSPAPVAKGKWLTASVADDAKDVIAAAFDEAERRDPGHLRPWVALGDGAKHQSDVINAEARRRNIAVTIVVDWIHVVEYIWAAARCFSARPILRARPLLPRRRWQSSRARPASSLEPSGARPPCVTSSPRHASGPTSAPAT